MNDRNEPRPAQWMKAELHAHCGLDPVDRRICPFSAQDLIKEAARLHYQVLAITCHDLDIWTRDLAEYAAGFGITLIPGMEVTAGGKHVLVYNFGARAEHLRTWIQIRALSRPDTLVVAPHAYFPSWTCLGRDLETYIDVFDAIEVSGFRTAGIDFNRRARALAAAHRKPLVGNSDVHQLWQLGRTFTWIHARPDPESVIGAVKEGKVRVEESALSYVDAVRFWMTALMRAAFAPRSQRGNRRFVPDTSPKESGR